LAAFIASSEHFFKLLLVDEEKASCIIAKALDFQRKYIARLLELDVDILIGDPMASTSIISPALFKKYAYEPLRVLVKDIKDHHHFAGIHICGSTQLLMPLLDDIGADILSVEDITPATRTLKMGGVSTTTIFQGNREKIKKEIKLAAREPRLIFGTACDVPIETDPENVKAMIKAAREIISGVNP